MENNIFSRKLDKINCRPNFFTDNRRPFPQDQKLLEGAEIKELLKKGAVKEVTSSRGPFVSKNISAPQEREDFRSIINLKNLNLVLPYQEFKMQGLKQVKDVIRPADLLKIPISIFHFNQPQENL